MGISSHLYGKSMRALSRLSILLTVFSVLSANHGAVNGGTIISFGISKALYPNRKLKLWFETTPPETCQIIMRSKRLMPVSNYGSDAKIFAPAPLHRIGTFTHLPPINHHNTHDRLSSDTADPQVAMYDVPRVHTSR